MFLFKFIGVYLGVQVATLLHSHPLFGAVAGFIIGHSVDLSLLNKIQTSKNRKRWAAQASAQASQHYMVSVYQMMGRVALADGKIGPEEQAAIDKVTQEVFRLKRRDKKVAQQILKSAGQANTSFQLDAAHFLEMHKQEPNALENMIFILLNVAVADGDLKEEEEQLIQTAARVFAIPEKRYREIISMNSPKYAQRVFGSSQRAANGNARTSTPSSDDRRGRDYFYSVLGCKPEDGVDLIKQRYRKLVSDYHPDKIVSKELPEDFTAFANEKFKAIQEAYEAVRTERGFK